MKLQCELCREIVTADLAIDGGAILVHCPACARSFTVVPGAAAAPARPAEPVDAGAMICPKCGLAQRRAAACRACGLYASLMGDFTARDVAGGPPEVAAAWEACVAAWDEPGAHEALVRAAADHDAYAWVARRYHDRLRADPADPIAQQREAAIARIAEASLRAGAAPRADRRTITPGAPSPTPYRSSMTILIALVLLAATGTIYAIVSTPASDTASAAPIPVQPIHHR